MKKLAAIVLAVAVVPAMVAQPVFALESAQASVEERKKQFDALPWITAPAKPPVAGRAELSLSGKDVMFLDANGTNGFLKLTGNLPEPDSYTLFSKNGGWFAIHTFSDIGFVKDDEKIDAAALLQQMKDGDAAQNEARAEQGLTPLTTVGWAVAPHYDPVSKNLEYGLILASPDGQNVNYHMRMLGRRGVMDAALVTDQANLQSDLASFRTANKGFAFTADESYAAFREGDKVSEYSLAALVTGGAVAVAAKKGLFAGLILVLVKMWKLIAIGLIALAAAGRRLFGGKRAGDEDDGGYQP